MTPRLTLEVTERICDATLAAARAANLQALTVIILDAGGHCILLKREDGAGFFREKMAHAKAYGALGFGKGTRFFAELNARNPGVVASMVAAIDGHLFPSPGGVLIRTEEGQLLGALGVSGDIGERDEAAAVAGIQAAGLTADTGAAT